MKCFLLETILKISIIITLTMANDFDCPHDCECRINFNSFHILCKANGIDQFSMEYSNSESGEVAQNRQQLRLICHTKNDFYEFLPELKLSPYINIQFYDCDINQTSIRRLEVRLFEDHTENLLNLEVTSNYFHMLSGFEKLPHLEQLAFYYNNIENIDPKLLHPMTNLRRLYFINNNITFFPSKLLKNNKRLEKITIEEYTLEELPDSFLSNFPNLNFVEIECNLGYLSENLFKGSKNIEKLYIRYNDLWKIPIDVFIDQSNLTDLSLEKNYITILHEGVFRNLKKLSNLNLARNRLRNISEYLFADLISLEVLSLNDNLIHIIDAAAFEQNSLLRYLNLQNNHISLALSNNSMFMPLKFLKKLNLANNHINEFHFSWLSKKYHFEHLDLSGNEIGKLHLKELPVNPIKDASKGVIIDLGNRKVNEMSVPEQNIDLYAYSPIELISYTVKMSYSIHLEQFFNETSEYVIIMSWHDM
uniref:CSON002919 protein n=1 Tax=Culicoides sonorensis TaxID=179676 RepID=A0A336K1L4_CULSO